MRTFINSTYITLDGAVENPHLWPSVGDSGGEADAVQWELLQSCDAVLMGRRTYESFAAVWPTRAGDRFADRINAMPKYVVSTTLRDPAWSNTTVIRDDVPGALARLRRGGGGPVVQYGIGAVTRTLLEHGLLDELRLWVYPLLLGRGGPATPHFLDFPTTRLRLEGSTTLPNGVTILRHAARHGGAPT